MPPSARASSRFAVALFAASIASARLAPAQESPGTLEVDKADVDGRVVLNYATYGCECDHACVYRSSSPVNLIDPAHDVSAQGTFSGNSWFEDTPAPGSISYYARTTIVDDPQGGISHQWQYLPTGAPTAPITDAAHVWYAAGNRVYGHDAISGSSLGLATVFGSVERPPAVATLDDGERHLFVATSTGYLQRLRASTVTADAWRDLRRGACPTDQLFASPVVQVRSLSNEAFQSAVGQDLVFVGTRHGCGDTTQNQVFALTAGDPQAAPVWVFNIGDYEMDYVAGCALDYGTNTLFCASHLAFGAYQNTIWAINTLDGSLRWATNAGSIHGRPFPNSGSYGHLFAVNTDGKLMALDADTGEMDWELQLVPAGSPGGPTEADVVAIGYGPYRDLVLAADGSGVLHAVYDACTVADCGIEAWASSFPGGQKVVDAPAVAAGAEVGKLYVPLSDSTVHQLDLSSGSDDAVRTLCPVAAGAVTRSPAVGLPGLDPGWIVAAGDSTTCGPRIKKFCAPWAYASSGS